MPVDRVPGLILPLIYLVAGVGVWWALRRERREPTSYTQTPMSSGGMPTLAEWRAMSTAEQEAYDNAVLDAAEAAEEAVRRAVDAQVQRAIEDAARRSSLFRF